ncbi:unnamed protein product [Blepharisma stoltei]|uniref:Ubiquitin fusion degradaton protein n=1 Tax=Blepharisma stoltei TaxID=1481888 RepID=A0AAU9JGK8_9CILI|nr:unnamed protein product [Blepharisma stoltei]
MFFQSFQHQSRHSAYFELYKAFPASFFGKTEVEKGNFIILPTSAAQRLVNLRIDYPMLFKLTNTQLGLFTHCGVLEFTAEEGTCLLPYWLMNHLGISEGGDVSVESIRLPRGTFVKIQPHTTAFIDLPNPKAVLENALRSYACLSQGDSISVQFAGRSFEIDIIETRPGPAIMTIQTDLEVDFAPPKDYREEAPQLKKEASLTYEQEEGKQQSKTATWQGSGNRLDGKPVTNMPRKESTDKASNEYDPRKHRLVNGVKKTTGNAKTSYWDTLGSGNTMKK